MWWAFIGVQLPQRLVSISSGPGYERSAYMCLLAKSPINSIMHRRRNRSSEAKFKCCFDLWQGNGRRYCKIQYNDTGTGSYPLPVEVPSPVLLGVGARSRCRCSRHSEKKNAICSCTQAQPPLHKSLDPPLRQQSVAEATTQPGFRIKSKKASQK